MRLTTYLLSRLLLSGTIILILTISWLMFTNHERAQQDVRRIGDTVFDGGARRHHPMLYAQMHLTVKIETDQRSIPAPQRAVVKTHVTELARR